MRREPSSYSLDAEIKATEAHRAEREHVPARFQIFIESHRKNAVRNGLRGALRHSIFAETRFMGEQVSAIRNL